MLSVNWSNESSVLWTKGQCEWNPPPQGRMTALPQDTLQAGSGVTSMTMTVTLQDAENMGEEICVWWAQVSDSQGNPYVYWFGTQLYQPVNIVHAGYPPYYAICAGFVANAAQIPQLKMESIGIGNSPGADLWRRPVADPGQPYYFTAAADHLPTNLKIGFVPVAGGEDLQVSVTISNIVIVISPRVLPPATGSQPYQQQLTATGDASPYTFSCGNLPTGMQLSPQGLLSGTPAGGRIYWFQVRATDPSGNYADQSYDLTVN